MMLILDCRKTCSKGLLFASCTILFLMLFSCTTPREAGLFKTIPEEEEIASSESVLDAVIESGRFIVKMNAMFGSSGKVNLMPRLNYILVDREKAIIYAAYYGPKWGNKSITGINMRGNTEQYRVTSNDSRGLYEVDLKVVNLNASFFVRLSIGKDGKVNVSIDESKIVNARYMGYIVPIKIINQQIEIKKQENESMIYEFNPAITNDHMTY